MQRFPAIVLCALAAVVATATPAPEPKPWVTGWDKPVDPQGDCRFEREGERLSITVPGTDHDLDDQNAPHLLRDVEGDFTVEVRVSVDSRVPDKREAFQRAGLLVTGGDKGHRLTLTIRGQPDSGRRSEWVLSEIKIPRGPTVVSSELHPPTLPPRRSSFLRLQRRGQTCRLSFSDDGKQWQELHWPRAVDVKLPRKLKVGVFAEANVEGELKVVFDHFKLSRPGKEG